MKKNKKHAPDKEQMNLTDIAEAHPWFSWACKLCGYHAKTDIQKEHHEKKPDHNQWVILKWNNGAELRNSPPKFSFVDPLY